MIAEALQNDCSVLAEGVCVEIVRLPTASLICFWPNVKHLRVDGVALKAWMSGAICARIVLSLPLFRATIYLLTRSAVAEHGFPS